MERRWRCLESALAILALFVAGPATAQETKASLCQKWLDATAQHVGLSDTVTEARQALRTQLYYFLHGIQNEYRLSDRDVATYLIYLERAVFADPALQGNPAWYVFLLRSANDQDPRVQLVRHFITSLDPKALSAFFATLKNAALEPSPEVPFLSQSWM